MKSKNKITKPLDQSTGDQNKDEYLGYPIYPAKDDIYSQYQEEKELNPEDITKSKEPFENTKAGKRNEKDFADNVTGTDLDIPGAELDDVQENIGSEDEENNYYSLGGENHRNLEEDQGDYKGH